MRMPALRALRAGVYPAENGWNHAAASLWELRHFFILIPDRKLTWICSFLKFRSSLFKGLRGPWGAGVRWTPLPEAEAPTEPAGETRAPGRRPQSAKSPESNPSARGEFKNSPVDCF